MKDLLLYLVQQIALEPDKVSIDTHETDGVVEFEIKCAKEDMGRIIGKKGKVIKALRRVLGILAVKDGKRVSLTMIDETPSEPE